MAWPGHDRYEVEFMAETARLGAAVSELDPQAPVPTCPEWTVHDLVTHVGTGHRWAAEIVEGRLQDPPPYAIVGAPQEPQAWADWLGLDSTPHGVEIAGDRALFTHWLEHSRF
jgi:uncharacterized protein (TIGR03083 family)